MPKAPARLGFAGSPEIARAVLDLLCASGWRPELVLTQPDRPAGRGRRLRAGPVKQLAQQHGIEVLQPERLGAPPDELRLMDLLLVAAYGQILPEAVLSAPRLGCINLHFSLLPAWRGAAPIERAIWAGDTRTGLSLMQMDAGLDTGPVLAQLVCDIAPDATAESLRSLMVNSIQDWLPEQLDLLLQGRLTPQPQDEARASYAGKIAPSERDINWHDAALRVDRQVRALYPNARTRLPSGQWLKVLKVSVLRDAEGGQPGEILSADAGDLRIACGTGAVHLLRVQRAGGRPCSGEDWLRGSAGEAPQGEFLGAA
ncbi:MAG: methionyl-tRNA formyltransferase [Gammaproteobacteria bacterium AqS3]|nr:methionyl-tRNA formyltransferase [Gammaproteobacteria bacterium AqS3]